jgi:hypothetical protein
MTTAAPRQHRQKASIMSVVAYTSHVRLERRKGPLRMAYLPGEAQPVTFSVHGAIAEHYKIRRIHVKMRLQAPAAARDTVDRVHGT